MDFEELMPELEDVDIAMGYFFSVATMLLYVPQTFGIWHRRSTYGLSISTLCLTSAANICSFFTTLLLDYYLLKGCSGTFRSISVKVCLH